MRKSKACDATKLEKAPLRIRRCILKRNHTDDKHLDQHGRWDTK